MKPSCLLIKHGLLLLSQVSYMPCASPAGPINLVREQFGSLLELHCHIISSTTLAPYGKIHDPKVIKANLSHPNYKSSLIEDCKKRMTLNIQVTIVLNVIFKCVLFFSLHY